MMLFLCKKCSSNSYYLSDKGNNVGLFCSECSTWDKWVSKKNLYMYKNEAKKEISFGDFLADIFNELMFEDYNKLSEIEKMTAVQYVIKLNETIERIIEKNGVVFDVHTSSYMSKKEYYNQKAILESES